MMAQSESAPHRSDGLSGLPDIALQKVVTTLACLFKFDMGNVRVGRIHDA